MSLINTHRFQEVRGAEGCGCTDPHAKFLWHLLHLGVINLDLNNKPMDSSTQSMRHTSAMGM